MNIYMSYNLHVVQTDEKGVLSFRNGLTTNFLLTKTFKQRIFALYKLAKKIYFFLVTDCIKMLSFYIIYFF